MRVLLTSIVMLLVSGYAGGARLALAQYPPPGAIAAVGDNTVFPGGSLTVLGSGWQPGSFVDLDFLSRPVSLGDAHVDQQGGFSEVVTVPEGATPGPHSIRVSGTAESGMSDTVFIPVRVVATRVAAGPSVEDEAGPLTLPFTGVVVRVWMIVLVGLFALGLLARAASRRRARSR